jgi:hypothetical protein
MFLAFTRHQLLCAKFNIESLTFSLTSERARKEQEEIRERG